MQCTPASVAICKPRSLIKNLALGPTNFLNCEHLVCCLSPRLWHFMTAAGASSSGQLSGLRLLSSLQLLLLVVCWEDSCFSDGRRDKGCLPVSAALARLPDSSRLLLSLPLYLRLGSATSLPCHLGALWTQGQAHLQTAPWVCLSSLSNVFFSCLCPELGLFISTACSKSGVG